MPEQTIGASYGDALMVAIGVGLVAPETDWARTGQTITTPDPGTRDIYDTLYGGYCDLSYPGYEDPRPPACAAPGTASSCLRADPVLGPLPDRPCGTCPAIFSRRSQNSEAQPRGPLLPSCAEEAITLSRSRTNSPRTCHVPAADPQFDDSRDHSLANLCFSTARPSPRELSHFGVGGFHRAPRSHVHRPADASGPGQRMGHLQASG